MCHVIFTFQKTVFTAGTQAAASFDFNGVLHVHQECDSE